MPVGMWAENFDWCIILYNYTHIKEITFLSQSRTHNLYPNFPLKGMIYVILEIPLIEGCHVFYPRKNTKASYLGHHASQRGQYNLVIFNLLQYSYIIKCQLRGCNETDCGSKNRQLIPITLVNKSRLFLQIEKHVMV